MTFSFAIEEFFPYDLLMDILILGLVQRALDRLCIRRLLCALLVLQLLTLFCLTFSLGGVQLQLLACPMTALALLGRRRLSVILEAAAGLFCAYAAAAGFAVLAGKQLPAFFAGTLVFCILLHRRRHIRTQWNIEILVEYKGMQACFPALIDTGNRLREHKSGLPVLIVRECAVDRLVPATESAHFLRIPYGVLGSSGELRCFRPDSIRILSHGCSIEAPECLVGIFPDPIPGRITALAPPEFVRSMEQLSKQRSILKKCRRFHHGIFKHQAIHLRTCRADPSGLGMLHRRQ